VQKTTKQRRFERKKRGKPPNEIIVVPSQYFVQVGSLANYSLIWFSPRQQYNFFTTK